MNVEKEEHIIYRLSALASRHFTHRNTTRKKETKNRQPSIIKKILFPYRLTFLK